MPLKAPRKREREHAQLRGKLERAKGRALAPNPPPAQIALAIAELAEAVEELRALVERSGGR